MDVLGLIRSGATLPLRTAAFGVRASAVAAGIAVNIGEQLVPGPIRQIVSPPSALETMVRVAFESIGATEVRRCYSDTDGAWIEVRGLRDTPGRQLGTTVLAAVRRLPGVTSAHLNYPLSRILVRFSTNGPTCAELCSAIDEAEARARAQGVAETGSRSPNLPGDDGVLAAKVLSVGISAAGLMGATAGRTFRLPRLPLVIGASVSVAKYQPRVRELLADQLGQAVTDRALNGATFVSRTLGQVPGALAVGLVTRVARVAETRATQRVWDHYSPLLARFAECSDVCPLPQEFDARGTVERYVDRSAIAQAISAAAAGVLSGNPDAAARAALVAIPKAAYTTRELFAVTLSRGMANDNAVLTLRPEMWRRLDRIDAVVIDPRCMSADLVAEARRSGLEVALVDDRDGALDQQLADTVTALHNEGQSTAVVTTAAAQACAAADIAIGVVGRDCPVPWYADVLVDDPAAVWRLLHAVGTARAASRLGVQIATGASVLGAAALLVPGVFGGGHGPGPVTMSAAVGQWTGYRMACRALAAEPSIDASSE